MRNRLDFLASAASVLALAVASASANAQSVPADAAPPSMPAPVRSGGYDAQFFAQYSPRNALDIVLRVPGFVLDDGNGDVRGFAGAAGNVVFDGVRPSSKSESLSTLLTRIPASRVMRVEIGSGSQFGSEYAGKSQVLNVILSAQGGFDGTATGSLRTLHTGAVVPNLSGSATWKRGASTVNLSAGTGREDTADEGTDVITDLLSGELIERRRKYNRYRPHTPFIAGSWAVEQAPDRAMHLNARFSRFTEDFDQINRVYPTGSPMRDDRLFMVTRSPAFEVGGDISRPLAKGSIKLVGLANRRTRDSLDTVLERIDDRTIGGFEQGQDLRLAETLGRLTWTRSDLMGANVEVGAEAAMNELDARLDLFVLDDAGGRERIDLPIDQAKVSERRGEIYVKAGRQVTKALRIDAGVNYEMSRLKVRGDTTADRTLKFLKPSLTIDWKPGKDWHGQLSARRTVAQLDFYDFISSAQLSDDRVNGGNADLEPQRAWELRVSIDRPLFGSGLAKLDLGYDRISKLQDRILTDEGFDAPGNIGTGKRVFATLALDAPLDRFGLKGVRAKLQSTVQRTRVHDPISDEPRDFSNYFPSWEWYFEMRRDAGKWAYGFDVGDRDRFTIFRSNEEDINFNGGVFGNAFAEYRPDGRTTVGLKMSNAFSTHGIRDRQYTLPNRSFDGPNLREYRERNSHRTFELTVKRTFGGEASKTSG